MGLHLELKDASIPPIMAGERPTGTAPQESKPLESLPGTQLIREVRRLRGFSQSEVAQMTDLSQGYLSQLENGKIHEPGYLTTINLAKALGLGLNFSELDLKDSRVFLMPEARQVLALSQQIDLPERMSLLTYIRGKMPQLETSNLAYIDQFPKDQSIGEEIKQGRQMFGLSQGGLADAVCISQGHLSTIENGEVTNPKMGIIRNIAEALGSDIYTFLGLKVVNYPEEVIRVDQFFRNERVPLEVKMVIYGVIASQIKSSSITIRQYLPS